MTSQISQNVLIDLIVFGIQLPSSFIHKFVDQPTFWLSDLSSSQITDSTASPRIAGADHSKGHQRLCSLLTLTARQTMDVTDLWESACTSLWTSLLNFKMFFFHVPHSAKNTCCILETSLCSTLTSSQAEVKDIPGKSIGQNIKSICSMCCSCDVYMQSEGVLRSLTMLSHPQSPVFVDTSEPGHTLEIYTPNLLYICNSPKRCWHPNRAFSNSSTVYD